MALYKRLRMKTCVFSTQSQCNPPPIYSTNGMDDKAFRLEIKMI